MRKTIKGLENEIAKLKADIAKLRKAVSDYETAMLDLSMMTDQILATVTEKYGEKVDDAGYRIQYPSERVKTVLNDYYVSSKMHEEENRMVMTFGIIKRVNETESAAEKPAEADH